MRILLSLLALSSCLLLTMPHGTEVTRIDAHTLRIEGRIGHRHLGRPGHMATPGTTLPKMAGYVTRQPSGAATGSSG